MTLFGVFLALVIAVLCGVGSYHWGQLQGITEGMSSCSEVTITNE